MKFALLTVALMLTGCAVRDSRVVTLAPGQEYTPKSYRNTSDKRIRFHVTVTDTGLFENDKAEYVPAKPE